MPGKERFLPGNDRRSDEEKDFDTMVSKSIKDHEWLTALEDEGNPEYRVIIEAFKTGPQVTLQADDKAVVTNILTGEAEEHVRFVDGFISDLQERRELGETITAIDYLVALYPLDETIPAHVREHSIANVPEFITDFGPAIKKHGMTNG